MNATTTAPARANRAEAKAIREPDAAYPAARLMPAVLVEHLGEPSQMCHFFGTLLVQTSVALCNPAIENGDVLEVNFDRRRVAYDGLYLLSISQEDGSQWFGARFFQITPSGTHMREESCSGPKWIKAAPKLLASITIFGEVLEVFKLASKMKGAA